MALIYRFTLEYKLDGVIYLPSHIVTQQGEIGPELHSCAVQCCHLTPAPAH